ncbi:MAG: hypothetical protein JXQ29_05510 [Planctomycetes bacterium]|nr:hypothetical protein [Planctomycetota bacterium]
MVRVAFCLAALCLLPGLLLEGVWLRGEVLYPRGLLERADQPWAAMVPAGSVNAANPVLSDAVYQFLPWDRVARRHWEGIMPPLWNPHGGLGASLVGNPQAALLDPIRLAATPVGFRRAPAVRAWLRLALAGLLCFGFLRHLGLGRAAALLGAAAFQLGGFLIPWLSHPHAGAALCLPALLWAGSCLLRGGGGGALAATAASYAALFLAGHPQTGLHVTVLAALFWALGVRGARLRGWVRLGAALVLGGLLAAPMLLPFVEYLRSSLTFAERAAGPGEALLPVRAAATFAIPHLFGWPLAGDWHGPLNACESVAYIGLVPWLLAPFAFAAGSTRRPALACLTLGCVSAAAAYGLPGVRELLAGAVPFGWVANRRLLLGIAFAGAVLGALGFDALLRRPDARNRAGWWGALGVALAAAAGVAFAAGAKPDGLWAAFRACPSGWAVFAATVLVVLGLLRLVLVRRLAPRWCGLLLAGLVLDLGLQWRGFQPTAPAGEVMPTTPSIEALRARARPGDRVLGLAVAGRERVLTPNTLQVFGLGNLWNFDSLGDPAYLRRLRAATGVPTSARLESAELNVFGPRFLATPVPLERLASAARLLPGCAHAVVFDRAPPRAAALVLLSYLAEGEDHAADAIVAELRVRAECGDGRQRDRTFAVRAGRETADAAIAQLGHRVAHGPAARAWTFTVRDASGDPYPRHVYRAEFPWSAEWGRPLGAEIRYRGVRGLLEVEGLGVVGADGRSTLDPVRRPFFRGALLLYENEHAWPRAFLAGPGALEELRREGVRPVEIVEAAADRLAVRGEARPGEVLVVTEAPAAGWRAYLADAAGERRLAVTTAGTFFRAVALEPGPFRVRFVYRPPAFLLGLLLAAAAGGVLVALGVCAPILRRVQARRGKGR